jgi:hypothetical protein
VDVIRHATSGAVSCADAGVEVTRFPDGFCGVVAHECGLHLSREEAEALGRMVARLYFLGDDNK